MKQQFFNTEFTWKNVNILLHTGHFGFNVFSYLHAWI